MAAERRASNMTAASGRTSLGGSTASEERDKIRAATQQEPGSLHSLDVQVGQNYAPRRMSIRGENKLHGSQTSRLSIRRSSLTPELGLYTLKRINHRLSASASVPEKSAGSTLATNNRKEFVSLYTSFRSRFGASRISHKFQEIGSSGKRISDEYYTFYFKTYMKQWRCMNLAAIVGNLVFVAYVYARPSLRAGATIPFMLPPLLGVMCSLPFLELALSYQKNIFHHYSLAIHMVMLLLYGCILASMELFLNNLHPPGYMYLYLLMLYSGAFQPAWNSAMIGITVSALDVWFTIVSVKLARPDSTDPDILAIYSACYLGTTTIPCGRCYQANIALHIAANMIGILYNINSWNYTRKTFLYNSDLTYKNENLKAELRKAEYIALSILPKRVWDELKGGQHQRFNMDSIFHKSLMYQYTGVTVLFADIVGFTALSGTVTASELVKILNHIFFQFDGIVENYHIEKIKTIGDCYMFCAGAPELVEHHEIKAVMAALRMIEVVERLSGEGQHKLAVRVGIHTGSVYAGLVGDEKFIFDVFSRDVSIASIVEQTGKPNQVHISEVTYAALADKCVAVEDTVIDVYGQALKTYFVKSVHENALVGQCAPQAGITTMKHIEELTRTMTMTSNMKKPTTIIKDPTRSSTISSAVSNLNTQKQLPDSLPSTSNIPNSTSEGIFLRTLLKFTKNTSKPVSSIRTPPTITKSAVTAPSSPFPADNIPISNPATRSTSINAPIQPRKGSDMSVESGVNNSRNSPNIIISSWPTSEEPLSMSRYHSRKGFSPLKEIHPVTCRFYDFALETEYYENYITNCQGKFAFAAATGLLTTLLLSFVDICVFSSIEPWLIAPLLLRLLLQMMLILLLIAKYLHPTLYDPSKTTHLTNMKPLERKLVAITSIAVTYCEGINFNMIAPFFIITTFSALLPHLSTVNEPSEGEHEYFAYLYAQQHIIMMTATLFTRSNTFTVFSTLLFTLLILEILQIYNWTNGNVGITAASIAAYLIAMLVGTYLVMRRNELYIRTNYLMKKQLIEKQFEIEDTRVKSERLLLKLLPSAVVEMLKDRATDETPREIAESVENAGILFCTICEFKEITGESMVVLNDIISKFDHMLSVYEIEKIKTIGPTYMCASGLSQVFGEKLPSKEHDRHPFNLANFALALRARLDVLNKGYPKNYKLKIGLDVGPIVAGIIGKNKFSFDIWGDTVNCASRMDSTNIEDHIQVTERLYTILKTEFIFEERGLVLVKGKGQMQTYFLIGRRNENNQSTTLKQPLAEMRPIPESDSEGTAIDISSATSSFSRAAGRTSATSRRYDRCSISLSNGQSVLPPIDGEDTLPV